MPKPIPPEPPPTPADDNWENDVLGDKANSGMSVEQARRILSINPSMRAQGVDTNLLIKQADQNKNGSSDDVPAFTKPPPGHRDSTMTQAKDVDHLLDLATEAFAQEKREIESEISILQAKLNGLRGRYRTTLMNRLALIDRNLSSPLTQAALTSHKLIVSELGFTPQKFIEHLKQRR